MVSVRDEGSMFEAPLDLVWRYILGGDEHDGAHRTTRNPRFEKVSDVTFLYRSERQLRGRWAPDRMRISIFPPVAVVTGWLKGVLAGSKMVYVYSAHGRETRIDVYGEFTSDSLPPNEVEAVAREFLQSEYDDDARAIRALALKRS